MDRIQASTKGIFNKNGVIQLRFMFQGQRVSPSVLSDAYNERNVRKWAERLNGPKGIKAQIKLGQFDFAAEFPDYRFMARVAPEAAQVGERTVTQVREDFIGSLEARGELARITVKCYRNILKHHVEPELGKTAFSAVTFAQLERIVNRVKSSKKTFNNVVSAIRAAWSYGYKNLPGKQNPALGLECVRLMKKDKPKPDPFSLADAEAMIAKTLELWGEEQANYEEFRFFTGLRPSEQIALEVPDCDMRNGTISVTKARVDGHDKDYTKTGADREVELCPRALDCLKRQLALRARLKLAGKIDHEKLFFHADGSAFHDLQVQWKRWKRTERALGLRHRDPYSARHTSVSWNLMVGKNPLWVAPQHGHSVAVMLDTYAAWTKGAKESDVAAIRDAMNAVAQQLRKAA